MYVLLINNRKIYMVYILETELSGKKSIYFALTKIYGIGNFNAEIICKKLGFSENLKRSSSLAIRPSSFITSHITELGFNFANSKAISLFAKNGSNIVGK